MELTIDVSTNFQNESVEILIDNDIVELEVEQALFLAQMIIEKSLNVI